MKLVTFQSIDAVKSLFEKGYLECDDKRVSPKYTQTYNWVINKMNQKISNKYNTKYPIWCWVKCYNSICPPKRKGERIADYDIKITFNKDVKDIFITDFRRYSFLLNNIYIPNTLKDKEDFDKKLKKYNITNDDLKAYVRKDKYKRHRTDIDFINICKEINKSFDRCITTESDILQGCVWRINLNEIQKIEILHDDGYVYGSINYIRSNGKRIDWQKDLYNKLN